MGKKEDTGSGNCAENIYFFEQYKSMGSSSRGIRSGGRILSVDDLLDAQYFKKLAIGSNQLLYQVGRGRLDNIIHMRIDEFEELFVKTGKLGQMNHLLGYDGNDAVFRKEILEKYGALAQKKKPSMTTKYMNGDAIEVENGMQYIYCGNIKLKVRVRPKRYSDEGTSHEYSGHLYIALNKNDTSTSAAFRKFIESIKGNYLAYEKYFTKNKRKAVVHEGEFNNLGALGEYGSMSNEIGESYLYRYERVQEVSWNIQE